MKTRGAGAAAGAPDFAAVFAASPAPALVLVPDLTIAAVNDAFLRVTATQRRSLVGRPVLAALHDDSDDRATESLRASLDRVLQTGRPDRMPVRQYRDRARPPPGDRTDPYWQPLNTPVMAADGGVAWIIHSLETVTEPARQLIEEQARIATVIEHLPVGVGLCDRDGRIVLSNAVLRRFVGAEIPSRAPDAMQRWQAIDAAGQPVPPVDFPPVRALRGETVVPGTEFLYRGGGVERWTRIGSVPMRDSDGVLSGAVFVIHDIDDEKRATDALRDREAQFRTLANSIPQLAWMAEPSGSVYWYNERWYEFTGTTLEQMRGWGWRAVHHPDHVDRVVAGVQHSWDTGEPWEDIFPLRSRDGGYRWFLSRALPIHDAAGRVERWFGTNTDVTEHREAEAALQRLTETLEQRVAERTGALNRLDTERSQLVSIVENSSELIAVADARLRVLYVNEAGRKLVGLDDLDAARRKRVLQFFFPADRRRVGREIFASVRENGRWAGELLFRHFQSGARIPVLYDVFRIDDPATGVLARYAMLGRDLTERKQAEELLQQSQKMEAVGQLTGGVAHDFNNLLTAITGSLELLEPKLGEDEGARRLLRTAQRGADRGAELTSQLLAFSRKQRLAPEILDINELIRGMNDLLQRTIGSAVEIRCSLSDALWPALVDAGQIEVAILNLALNARDAMAPGSLLTIATRNAPATAALPPEVAGQDCIVIAVADSGTGMTREVAARAFDPFFTTKEVGKGSGLGLSQVYGVVRQSGGTALLRSRPGKGTTVELFLPRAAAPPRAAEPEPVAPSARAGSAILLVDDDPDVRAMTTDMLRALGHQVMAAASGREALALLDGGTVCALLMIDLAMPGMNGAEAVTLARRVRPELAVLFTTGYADAAAFGDAVGDVPMIRKPFNLIELGAAVDAALRPAARRRAPRRPRG